MSASPSLQIQLFGAFKVWVDGELIEDSRWTRKKAKSLLKILALEKSHQLHREQLMDLLWPELDGEAALNNLHKAIHAARRTLEPTLATGTASRFLTTQNQLVLLESPDALQIDTDTFEQAPTITQQQLEAATALYTADLLEEDRYEDWATIRREHFIQLHQNLLDRLAKSYEQSNNLPLATTTLNKLLASAPSNEDAHRRLMAIHLATGQRHLAIQQYKLCRKALEQDLGTTPEPATERLYEQVQAGSDTLPTNLTINSPRKTNYLLPILSLIAIAAATWWYTNSTRPSNINSVAVFPLSSGGDLESLAYIGDGITENIINSLSQLPNLRVMARSTVFSYRQKKTDPRAAGREMNVSAVVTGNITQLGDQLKINAELVDVSDGARLWGQQFIVPAKDLSTIQTRLGTEIAAALQQKLTDTDRSNLSKSSTQNPAAYKAYLFGLFFLNQRSSEGFNKAIQNFAQAISIDPSFAAAHAGLANAHGLRAFADTNPRPEFELARQAANRALALDPNLAEAHTSIAMIAALFDWDWAKAESSFRRAIALSPGYSTAHHWFAVHLAAMSRFDESRAEFTKALDLDPLSPIIRLNSGYPDYYQRRFAQARSAYMQALELNPGFAVAHQELAAIAFLESDSETWSRQSVLSLSSDGNLGLAGEVERTFQSKGQPAALRIWIDTLSRLRTSRYISPVTIATLHIMQGETPKALDNLEQAFADRNAALVYLNVDPIYDSLRSQPRFKALQNKINLPAPKKLSN